MTAPPMFRWVDAQGAIPPTVAVGRNPPWNQPQVTPALLIRSPMLVPDICALRPEQSSNGGAGSPFLVPFSMPFCGGPAPLVWPAIRFSAPGVDGPNVEPKV